MTAEYMNLTAQAATSHWGWTIAFFLWFVGLSGMSLFLNYWVRSRRIHYAATAAAVVGTLLVVSHLGRILNLPAAAFNALIHWSFGFTSWMLIGICILAVLCVVTVLQAWLLTKGSALGMRCGLLAFDAVLGVAATAYSGFLLTQAVGVPLWTTAAIPVLWIFSGLACAVGLIEILAAAGKLDAESPRWLHAAGWAVHGGEAFVLFAFVLTALSGTPGAAAGAESLISGSTSLLFWGGAVGCGLLIPCITACLKSLPAAALGGAAAIIGALSLRAAILFAGTFDPVIWPL